MRARTIADAAAMILTRDRMTAHSFLRMLQPNPEAADSTLRHLKRTGQATVAQEMSILMAAHGWRTDESLLLMKKAPIERFAAVMDLPLKDPEEDLGRLARMALIIRPDVTETLYQRPEFGRRSQITALQTLVYECEHAAEPELRKMFDAARNPKTLAQTLLGVDIASGSCHLLLSAFRLRDAAVDEHLRAAISTWAASLEDPSAIPQQIVEVIDMLKARERLQQVVPSAPMMAAP